MFSSFLYIFSCPRLWKPCLPVIFTFVFFLMSFNIPNSNTILISLYYNILYSIFFNSLMLSSPSHTHHLKGLFFGLGLFTFLNVPSLECTKAYSLTFVCFHLYLNINHFYLLPFTFPFFILDVQHSKFTNSTFS